VLDAIERGETGGASALASISLGIRQLPEVAKDQTDRNRTSPFAFTGNKFEFRAVSSAQSISLPVAFLNAAVAEALGEFEAALTQRTAKGVKLQDAVLEIIREAVVATKSVRFEGNNYASEWVDEAKKRGLPNLKNSPEALAELVRPEAKEFLARTKVFTEAESDARYHVRVERYIKDIDIEVEALKNLVTGHVFPAAYRQLALLNKAGAGKSVKASAEKVDGAVESLSSRMADLQAAVEKAGGHGDIEKHARHLADKVLPAMAAVREICDKLEESVADEFWTLPKYREMLFLV
jgi:glutamine synthetase